MTARSIANRLLETDADFDPEAEIKRYSASQHHGISIEAEANKWNVYKEHRSSQHFIGEIYYDDMKDAPVDTMTPAAREYHDKHRWVAIAGFRDAEQTQCASFDEALNFILAINAVKTTPPITKKLDRVELDALYSDICMELFNTRDTGAISDDEYRTLEAEVARRQNRLRRTQESEYIDPDDPAANVERFAQERATPAETEITTAIGRRFRVRIVWDKPTGGTTYDVKGNVVPEKLQPSVEFYDMTHANDPDYPDFKGKGQFVSSYYASTLIADRVPRGCDLSLYGDERSWRVDAPTLDKLLDWVKEQVESRGYKLSKDRFFGHRYESLDPDDPEPYTHPERFTGQPSGEKIEGALRRRLAPYYTEVRISKRPGLFQRVGKGDVFKDSFVWTIHCNRDTPLPLPTGYGNVVKYGQNVDWRAEAKKWFTEWARESGLYIFKFEIYGRLRKDPTFQFETSRIGPLKEDEEMEPENYLAHFVDKEGINDDLLNALWQWHPTGVGYNVLVGSRRGFVIATTYFPPEKDNFAERFKEFVVDWLTKRKAMTVNSTKLTCSQHQRDVNYPRWGIILSINSDWPPETAQSSPPVEVGESAFDPLRI